MDDNDSINYLCNFPFNKEVSFGSKLVNLKNNNVSTAFAYDIDINTNNIENN